MKKIIYILFLIPMILSAQTNIVQIGQDIDGESYHDNSGKSVSFSSDGNTVAIGSAANSGSGFQSGHARIYSWDGTSWNQLGQDIDGEAEGDLSGTSVSLSSDGMTVAIGAYWNDGNGTNSGHVRIYTWDGTSWNQLGQDIDGEVAGDRSGYSVSLSSDGMIVAIGSPGHLVGSDLSNNSTSGQVRVYSYNQAINNWNQLGTNIEGDELGLRF